MAQKLQADYRSTRVLDCSREKAFDFLADIPRAVGDCFPDLASLDSLGEGRYAHRLQPIRQLGLTLKLHWEAVYTNDRNTWRLEWTTDPESGNAGLDGHIVLTEADGGTKVDISETHWLWLSIPRLTVPMARPLVSQTLKDMTERYLDNVKAALEEEGRASLLK